MTVFVVLPSNLHFNYKLLDAMGFIWQIILVEENNVSYRNTEVFESCNYVTRSDQRQIMMSQCIPLLTWLWPHWGYGDIEFSPVITLWPVQSSELLFLWQDVNAGGGGTSPTFL